MVDYTDQFMLNTNLGWDGSGAIVNQLRGTTFGVDGFATGDFIAESTTATIRDRSGTTDPYVDDLNGSRVQDRITVGPGDTLGAASGLLDYVVGIHQYQVTLVDGTTLTQNDFGGQQLPVRILDSSTGYKVVLDFSDSMLASLNQMPQVASISFPQNATQQGNYGRYLGPNYDNAYTPVCFTTGTSIQGADRVHLIEELNVGDMILTQDNGLQRIRWIGSREMSAADLKSSPKLRPVRIKA